MGKASIRKVAVVVGATGMGLALMSGTASAHVLTVTHPQTGQVVHEGWVGGFANFAAHSHGLVSACQAPGSGAAMIHTPWNSPANCTHIGP
jgi:hypothetical protein